MVSQHGPECPSTHLTGPPSSEPTQGPLFEPPHLSYSPQAGSPDPLPLLGPSPVRLHLLASLLFHLTHTHLRLCVLLPRSLQLSLSPSTYLSLSCGIGFHPVPSRSFFQHRLEHLSTLPQIPSMAPIYQTQMFQLAFRSFLSGLSWLSHSHSLPHHIPQHLADGASELAQVCSLAPTFPAIRLVLIHSLPLASET